MSVIRVEKSSYYKLTILLENKIKYKSGVLIIKDDNRQIFPDVYLPNIIFSTVKKESILKIDDLNELTNFNIYFKTNKMSKNIILDSKDLVCKATLTKIDKNLFINSVNLIEYRNKLDVVFTQFYLTNYTELKNYYADQKLINSTLSYYSLIQNNNLFQDYIKNLKVIVEHVDTNYIAKNKDKIRVLYLIDMSPQYESIGYTVRTHDLLKNINKKHEISALGCTRLCYPYTRSSEYYTNNNKLIKVEDDFIKDGVVYTKLLDKCVDPGDNDLVRYLKLYILSVIKLAFKLKIDVIHAATDYYNGIAAVYAAKYLGIKSVYEIRGYWEESSIAYTPYVYESDTTKLRSNLEDFVCMNADEVITINSGLQYKIFLRCGREAKLLINGVDVDQLKVDKELGLSLRHKMNILDSSIVVGYIGSLLVYEGLDYLLDAISRVKNVVFVFAGKGPILEELLIRCRELSITDRVVYLGVLTHSQCIEYYNAFDIVAYPRKNLEVCKSTSSSKLFEAMAMEKCLLVSRLEANLEVIIDGVNAVCCEPDSVDDLVNKLEMLVGDAELRNKLSIAARQYILDYRDWNKISNKLVAIYKNLLL